MLEDCQVNWDVVTLIRDRCPTWKDATAVYCDEEHGSKSGFVAASGVGSQSIVCRVWEV